MSMKAIVPTLDEIPELLREHYRDREQGGYILQVDVIGGFALEDVAGLKETLANTREKLRKSREKLEQFGDIEPSDAKHAMEKIGEMASWTPEDKVKQQIEARERQLVERHKKEKVDSESKVTRLKAALEKNLITTAATSAIARHRGVPELLLPVVERHVKMVESSDGEFSAQVVTKDGTPQISTKTGSVDPMTIDEFVENLRSSPDFGRAFEGTGASGSGSSGTTASTGFKGGKGRLQSGDQEGLNRNIESIASGKTVVNDF